MGLLIMSKYQSYVFVLWGDRFREAEAAIFVTKLRDAGLRVKVVGLTPHELDGAHGLALVPDLSLDQALPLASRAIGVIIPATLSGLKRLQNDPRVRQFFQQADHHRAYFVLGSVNKADVMGLGWLPVSVDRVICYPSFEDLMMFTQGLATRFLSVQKASS
jgi:hypothetical protein